MGFILNIPKPGFRNINDENTDCRLFIKPELSGEVRGLDVNLDKNFSI